MRLRNYPPHLLTDVVEVGFKMASYQEELEMSLTGVWSSPNKFTGVPKLSLVEAINLIIYRDGIVETRRGFKQYGNPISLTATCKSLYNFQDIILAWTDDGKLKFNNFPDWTDYDGDYFIPDETIPGSRVLSFQQNKNFYFATSAGVYKLDSVSNQPIKSGGVIALGGTAIVTGSSGWMPDNTAVAYKILWGYIDANDNEILGVPSERIIVVNSSGGTKNVDITFTVPFGTQIDTTWFFQIFRSLESASATDVPEDNYQQVYEANPTSGELSSKIITVTDIRPTDLREDPLYTSASQEGALSANYPPPVCTSMCEYKNYAMYANTREPHEFFATLLAVGPSLGIQVGDTLIFTSGIETFTLTGAASQDATVGEFLVDTSGSPQQNNESTARSIINVINTYTSNTFLIANYNSDFGDLAGSIFFYKRTTDSQNFYINSSRTTCWSPVIPATGQTVNNTSKNNVYKNRVYFSKLQEPEAVPLTNYLDFGSSRQPILNIIPLRDSVVILKADGVYLIVGDNLPFTPQTVDRTTVAIGASIGAALDNSVYLFTQEGICCINGDGSIEIKSTAIEKQLLTLSSSQYANFSQLSFGVGYQSDRSFILSTVVSTSDQVCNQQIIYNYNTDAFYYWDRVVNAGLVNPTDNKLYFSGELTDTGCWLSQERKSLDVSGLDYADEEYTVVITAFTGLTLTLDSVADVDVDFSIVQNGIQAIVESVNEDDNTITVSILQDWELGEAIVYTPIHTQLKTNPIFAGSPGFVKNTPEFSLILENPNFDHIDVTVSNDLVGSGDTVEITPYNTLGWGQTPWGSTKWGSDTQNLQRRRCYIDSNLQRNNWIQIEIESNQAFTNFALQGFSILSNIQSQRMR